jgi:hypothetical protein
MSLTQSDWFADLGLTGSETVLSAFVTKMLETQPSVRNWLLARTAEHHPTVDVSEANAADWRAAREWFVAGAGNVDILLRNRRRRWTFIVEHKVATRLSDGQIKKYADAVASARAAASGAPELVISCFLSPSGMPHAVDKLHDTSVEHAVHLDYTSFVACARDLPGVLETPAFVRCLDEMDRLARQDQTRQLAEESAETGQEATRNEANRDLARERLLDLIAAEIPGAKRVGFEVRLPDRRRVRVPHGRRQCVSILPVPDAADRTNISAPWPEPGMDAPWSFHDHSDDLIAEQARIVLAMLRSG